MKTLIGGAIGVVLGIIGLSVWWKPFLMLLEGSVPIMLLIGGSLALYLGIDELKDTWKKDEKAADTFDAPDDTNKFEEEISELKKEIENLKAEKEEKKE